MKTWYVFAKTYDSYGGHSTLSLLSPFFLDGLPDARRILDDPFFWDSANELAPNGNDTGADLLGDYREFLEQHSPDDAPGFLHALLDQWGLQDDELVCYQATIGLAFADLKRRGTCHPELRERALKALAQQANTLEADQQNPLAREWLASIRKLQAKLEDC